MDKREFKASVLHLLNQEVSGLAPDKKIRYIIKWMREYEQKQLEIGPEKFNKYNKNVKMVKSPNSI